MAVRGMGRRVVSELRGAKDCPRRHSPDNPCVRHDGEIAIDAAGKCAFCGISWQLANPFGTKRTPEHLRSDSVN